MTVNYADTAISKIRSYLWESLVDADILLESDYIADGFIQALVPIIPTQQVPEFNNLIGNKTYIIYDTDITEYYDQWWICQENAVFTIVSTDYTKITEIAQFMVDLFRRMDESATDINEWQPNISKFNFYTFTLKAASAPTPAPEEGGRQMAEIEISYKYSRNLDSAKRFV